jgi:hypothetical protein
MAKQRLIAFMAMLVLVTSCGIALIIWRRPQWLGLGPSPTATVTAEAPTAVVATPAGGATPSAVSASPITTAASTGATTATNGPTLAPVLPVNSASSATTAASAPPKKIVRPAPTSVPRLSPSLPPSSRL